MGSVHAVEYCSATNRNKILTIYMEEPQSVALSERRQSPKPTRCRIPLVISGIGQSTDIVSNWSLRTGVGGRGKGEMGVVTKGYRVSFWGYYKCSKIDHQDGWITMTVPETTELYVSNIAC